MSIRIHRLRRAGEDAVALERDGAIHLADDLAGRRVTMEDILTGRVSAAALGERTASSASPVDPAQWQHLPPTVERPAVYCAGANFADHVAEMGERAVVRPYHFISPPTTLAADGDDIRRPLGATMLDWEVELVAIVGRRAFRVPEAEALGVLAGYSVGNDVSVRGPHLTHPIFGVDWGMAKNGDGLTPIGPALVPASAVADPQSLGMTLTVDGVVRQRSSTDQMLVTVAQQIAAITRFTTLLPGDVILTGTPAGTARAHQDAYLQDGAVMVAEIEGIGRLTNRVVAAV